MYDTDGPGQATLPLQLSREQILDATAQCLRESGYDATTIRRIAAALDCAVGSIYRYFRDKRELLYAVTQRMLEPVADAAAQGVSVAECERQYLASAGLSPQMYRLMFWLACVEDASQPVGGEAVPVVVRRIIEAWARTLNDVAEARRRWMLLHGRVLLGDVHAAEPAFARETPPPAPTREKPVTVHRPVGDRHAVIAELSPLPGQPSFDHAPVAETVAADDLCLL